MSDLVVLLSADMHMRMDIQFLGYVSVDRFSSLQEPLDVFRLYGQGGLSLDAAALLERMIPSIGVDDASIWMVDPGMLLAFQALSEDPSIPSINQLLHP